MNEQLPGTGQQVDAQLSGALKGLLEMVPQLAGLVTTGTVLLSVLYNWAYFKLAYPSGLQLLTLSDHVASAIEWLPISIASFVIGAAIGWILPGPKRSTGGEAPDQVASRIRRRVILWTIFLILLIVAVVLSLGVSRPSDWSSVGTLALIVWPIIAIAISKVSRISRQTTLVAIFLPIFCISALLRGNGRAVEDLVSSDGNARILMKEQPALERAIVLRYLERGVLTRQVETSEVSFTPWEDIREISISGTKIEPRIRLCLWFGLRCDFGQKLSK